MSDLRIRPISIQDTSNIVRWRNKDFVRKNLYSQDLISEEQHLSYFRKYVETHQCYQYIICVDGIDVGTVFLKNFDSITKKAEFGIFIGEETALGHHYGTRATELILQEAFQRYQLNRVYLTVFADNKKAISAYENAGFKVEGTFIDDFWDGSVYHDIVSMAILAKDWNLNHS